MREPLRRRAGEGGAILVRRIVLERGRVRLAEVEQPVADRVDDELVVAVELLRLVAVGPRLGLVGLLRLLEQLGFVFREEVELRSHEVVEAA